MGLADDANPRGLHNSAATTSRADSVAMTDNPQLITSGSGKGEPINYVCSRFGRIFPLPKEHSPKEAVAILYSRFKDHIGQEHSERSPHSSAKPS